MKNRVFRFGSYYIWFLGVDNYIFFSKTFYKNLLAAFEQAEELEKPPIQNKVTI